MTAKGRRGRVGFLACILSMAWGAQAAELVINGSFEQNGGVDTNTFAGWTELDQVGGSGSFFVQTGTSAPGGFSCSGPIGAVPAPPLGLFAAMTVQSDPGSYILFQNVTIPPGSKATFTAQVYVNSFAPFLTPASLDYTLPNQQARIDIMTTGSALTDVGAGVLLNLYQTKVGDPQLSGYNTISADLSAFSGQTVRLRIASAVALDCFSFGVDGVSIQAESISAVPVLSNDGLFALGTFLLMAGLVAMRLKGCPAGVVTTGRRPGGGRSSRGRYLQDSQHTRQRLQEGSPLWSERGSAEPAKLTRGLATRRT